MKTKKSIFLEAWATFWLSGAHGRPFPITAVSQADPSWQSKLQQAYKLGVLAMETAQVSAQADLEEVFAAAAKRSESGGGL